MVCPEFITYPGVSDEENGLTITFSERFAEPYSKKELAAGTTAPLMADLVGSPLWEFVYRCTYSFHWRALSDARLVLRQMYGAEAKFQDFVAYYKNGPVIFEGAKPVSGDLNLDSMYMAYMAGFKSKGVNASTAIPTLTSLIA